MEMINEFKRAAGGGLRLSVEQVQLKFFWDNRTLTEMAQIFSLKQPYVLNFLVTELLQPYLAVRKVTQEAYLAALVLPHSETPLLYLYDCKIFRSLTYTREDNDLLSAFLLLYREDQPLPALPIHELVAPANCDAGQWTLQVKESALLRTFGTLRQTVGRTPHPSDKIVLPQSQYAHFLQCWIKCYCNYSPEHNVRVAFQAILVLLENQLLTAYVRQLTAPQLHHRMYQRAIRKIEKPRNKQQFTLTEQHFGEIRWQTLKIPAFQLKYLVREDDNSYHCYLPQQNEEEEPQLQGEDADIHAAWMKVRRIEEEYESL